jgi:CAAX prenyl protease-like protein
MTNGVKNSARDFVPYTLPFLLIALCIYLGSWLNIRKDLLYPFQTLLTAGCLLYFRKDYRNEIRFLMDWLAVAAGVAVFFVWILLEDLYPQNGSASLSPYGALGMSGNSWPLVPRLIGAVLIVPLAEELFWRSFGLRFLVKSDFKSVPLGYFTWFSFILVSLAFGFEHHRWLPGIIAGLIYAGLLYRSKNLFSPILGHGVTNLLLGIYVISTGRWEFW